MLCAPKFLHKEIEFDNFGRKTCLRGDLIEMYKLLTQKENVDYKQFFQKEDNHRRLRGHTV